PGPRRGPPPVAPSNDGPRPVTAADEPDEEDEGFNLFSSPWFWGGLGVVVATGVTVFILSRTALNEPDEVMIQGRIAP
ncbi:MAG: hypothetical protein AAGN82_32015, partial [Myxococcota bacterium]